MKHPILPPHSVRRISSSSQVTAGPRLSTSGRNGVPSLWNNIQLLPLLAVLALTGCKQDVNVTVDRDPIGTYTLISVNSNKVPCSVEHEGVALTVKSGAMVFHTNQTCTSISVFTPPSGNDVQRDVEADYQREGSKLTMRWHGAGMTTGTLTGDQFSMDNEGMIFVYQK